MSYRWSKLIPEADSESWEDTIFALGLPNLMFVARPGKRTCIEGYFETQNEAQALKTQFGGAIQEVSDDSWLAAHTQQGEKTLIRVRDRFVVSLDAAPEWLAELRLRFPGRELLIFPPDMAFGTGDHATTATCLRTLVDLAARDLPSTWSHLDLGTGTGILAIASKLLGAKRVVATELDPLALAVARKTPPRHGLAETDIEWREQDALAWKPGKERYELVTANMYSSILIQIMGKIRQVLAPGGWVILSGIMGTQAAEVEAALTASGLSLQRRTQRGKWVTLTGRRN